MTPPTYLYVVTSCNPTSSDPIKRQTLPEAILRTEEEAERFLKELKKMVVMEPGEGVIHTICRAPFIETSEQFKEILS